MARGEILLVEDDEALRELLAMSLRDAGFEVEEVSSGQEALRRYAPQRHDVVLTDVRMPGMDGLALLRALRALDEEAVVIVSTAFGSTDRALEAMRQGAYHYVEKPVNPTSLTALLTRAVAHRRPGHQREPSALISASPAMNEVLRVVDKVARSQAAVLLRGESGTGKELVARALHERSARAARPFVAVNCAAIPAELLESTLFGHEKGAFTGATRAGQGKFLTADGGTIFLDEIAEMSAPLQSKLLRVLQDGEVDVIGQPRPTSVDVRVVAATHQDMEALIGAGRFRQDLFYRLNVVPIVIPPLRDRREDIPVLVRHLMRRHEPGASVEVRPEVDAALLRYDWPGNVRELENVIRRMLLLREGDALTGADVPAEVRLGAAAAASASPAARADALPFVLPEGGLDLMALERAIIEAALLRHDGNQSATARYLNIPRHVLLYRLEKYAEDDAKA